MLYPKFIYSGKRNIAKIPAETIGGDFCYTTMLDNGIWIAPIRQPIHDVV